MSQESLLDCHVDDERGHDDVLFDVDEETVCFESEDVKIVNSCVCLSRIW
jgi:hypothetical protein